MSSTSTTHTIGDACIFTDPVGVDHAALVTNAYGTAISSGAVINVVFVSDDTARTDSYGRQVERETSVQHMSQTPAHGRYWRRVDEAKKAASAPSQAHEAAKAAPPSVA